MKIAGYFCILAVVPAIIVRGDRETRAEEWKIAPPNSIVKKIAGFSIPVPAGWNFRERAMPSNQLSYVMPVRLRVKRCPAFPAIVALYTGRCTNPEKELKSWTERTFMPGIYGSLKGVTIVQEKTERVQVPGATAVSWTTTRAYMEKVMHSHTVTVVTSMQGHSVLFGITYEHADDNSMEDVQTIKKSIDSLAEKMLECAAASSFTAPPPRQAWNAFLAKKERWRYEYDSRIGVPPGALGFFVDRIHWTFTAGGTASVRSSDFSGMGFSVYSLNDPELYLRGQRDANADAFKISAPFAVRGSGDGDLWIFLELKNGMGTFHRLEPEAAGTFVSQKIKGVAIDGRIEGSYGKEGGAFFWKP